MVNSDSRLVFSWPSKTHSGAHPVLSANVAQGLLEMDRPLGSTQSNPFEGKGLVTLLINTKPW